MLYIDLNGRLIPETRAQISVFDSALLYGEGLFETLRAVDGNILFLDRHLDRLWRSCRAIGFPPPVPKATLVRRLKRLLKANRLCDAYVRINVSLNEVEVGDPRRRRAGFHVILFAKPFLPYPARCYTKGARLVIIRSVVNDPLPLANIKSTNYLAKIMARRDALLRGADEGILLNIHGRITEGASSNIFIVRRGVVMTPPLSEGVMPGVTRDRVREICRSLKIPYRFTPLAVNDLRRADEIFITSTLKGVMPVGWIEGRRLRTTSFAVTPQIARGYPELGVSNAALSRGSSSAKTR